MDGEQKPILVTGASTGIGRHLAERLAGLGHLVFATVRRPDDLESLARIPGVAPVHLDVRDPGDVARVVRQVEARGCGLHGLVNNAGWAARGSSPPGARRNSSRSSTSTRGGRSA